MTKANKFKVKNIEFFHDDLFKVSESEILKKNVLSSYIFHMKKRGEKPILILRAGDIVDSERLEHFKSKKMDNFYHLDLSKSEKAEVFYNYFNQLEKARLLDDQNKLAEEIIFEFSKLYYAGDGGDSLLLFVNACYEKFYNLDELYINSVFRKNPIMYSKTLITCSMAIIVALSNGVTDFSLLRDLYHCAFLMDFSISSHDISYFMQLACEAERKTPGAGLKFLNKAKVSEKEKLFFLNHPLRSKEFAMTLSESFLYPEILNIIELHHERSDGLGFPNKVFKTQMSRWENIISLADTLVPYEEFFYGGKEENTLARKWINEVLNNKNIKKWPFEKLLVRLKKAMSWAEDRSVAG